MTMFEVVEVRESDRGQKNPIQKRSVESDCGLRCVLYHFCFFGHFSFGMVEAKKHNVAFMYICYLTRGMLDSPVPWPGRA